MLKQCTKCQELKPATLEYFHKDRTRPDGINPRCKVCVKAFQQSIHPKMIEAAYRWRDANPDEAKAAIKNWQKNNPDKVQSYWLTENSRLKSRNWRAANREKSRQAARQWAKDNPVKNAIQTANHKALLNGSEGTYTEAEWTELCARYSYLCLCCKEQKPLTVDHVIPVTKGGRNDVSNLQPLCKECNSRKGQKTIDYRPNLATTQNSLRPSLA